MKENTLTLTLQLDKISFNNEGRLILNEIDLTLESGTIHTLLGSGHSAQSPRTILLRLMAGLEKPSQGKIIFNGEDITSLPIQKRNVAMVYEEFINYPHLTVFENIASPLRVKGNLSKKQIDERVQEMAQLFKLSPFLQRLPSQLSGGQQQRVSLARALAKEAKLILLDNPLINLDYKLREELREEFRQLFQRKNSVVIYATNDPVEALSLGGKTAVLKEGRILQYGDSLQVYQRPRQWEVAAMISDPPMNFFQGKIQADQLHLGETDSLSLKIPSSFKNLAPGNYIFGLRPHEFRWQNSDTPSSDGISLECEVSMVEVTGSDTLIHLLWQNQYKIIWERVGVHPCSLGEKIRVGFAPENFFVFSQSTGLNCYYPSQSL